MAAGRLDSWSFVLESGEFMRKKSASVLVGLALSFAGSSASLAQAPDPLTRLLDGVFKREAARPAAPAAPPAPPPRASAERAPLRPSPPQPSARPQPQTAVKPNPLPPQRAESPKPAAKPIVADRPRANTPAAPAKAVAAEPARTAAPSPPAAVVALPKASAAPVRSAAAPASQPIPTTPAAALDRVNAYFNSIDQLTASFVQSSTGGPRAEGTLAIKRPGQLHFAYAPPSSLEVVSDGRSVAVRDKKLGTNDVYSIRQTPLKFLVQDQVDLAKDTRIQDVQVGSDGMITVRFEDSATLGGTSKITLRFDARANALKQWTVIDAQGYETTVVLSGLNLVRRSSAEAN
jgi:outer membrane lipoprotein-sorting protein